MKHLGGFQMDGQCVKLEMKKKYEVELVKNTTEFEIFED